MSLGSRWRAALAWAADWQIVLVVLLAPIFMLADRLPTGVVALAVVAILPLWGIRRNNSDMQCIAIPDTDG